MGISRKRALERIASLEHRIREHLDTHIPELIAHYPETVAHWRHELREWTQQMEDLLRHIGTRTRKVWEKRLAELREQAQSLLDLE
jgi:hypothetical protein